MDRRDQDARTTRRNAKRRRYRTLPPAVTPLRATDVLAGVRGQLRGTGRDRFREAVVEFLGGESGGTYTSFRRALADCLLELAAADGADRRAVLVPAFCSDDFRLTLEGVDLEMVRYDVDPGTLSLDPAVLGDGLFEDALALVSVNVLGYGSRMDAISERCRAHDVRLVEALGYALGTRYRGRPLGTFGDCAVLNFQQGKPIPVGGGMVVSRDPELVFGDEDRSPVDPNLGTLAGYALFSRPRFYHVYTRLADRAAAYDLLPERVTTHPEPKRDVGYAPPFGTMSHFQGAVARRVLERVEDHRLSRARTARFYAEELAGRDGLREITPVAGLSHHQHVRYPLCVEDATLRGEIRSALEAAGVGTAELYHYPEIDTERFPGAARLQREILTLPTHPYVDEVDRRLVVDTIGETVDRWQDRNGCGRGTGPSCPGG